MRACNAPAAGAHAGHPDDCCCQPGAYRPGGAGPGAAYRAQLEALDLLHATLPGGVLGWKGGCAVHWLLALMLGISSMTVASQNLPLLFKLQWITQRACLDYLDILHRQALTTGVLVQLPVAEDVFQVSSINRLLRFLGIICAQFVGVEPQASLHAQGPGQVACMLARLRASPCPGDCMCALAMIVHRLHCCHVASSASPCITLCPQLLTLGCSGSQLRPSHCAGHLTSSGCAGVVSEPVGSLAAPCHCAGPVRGSPAPDAGCPLPCLDAADVHVCASGPSHCHLHSAPL